MHFAIAMFPTHTAIRPDALAAAVEERGFESLWFPEHTHIPLDARNDPAGNPLPEHYWRTYDPFVALTAAAMATKRLRLATGICLLIERDPIVTAKEVASLDVLSGGRFVFGIGGGWNAAEMADHGTEYRTRWTLLRERVEAMKALWTQDEASYQGSMVCFGPCLAYPKPLQSPHPPIHIGGSGDRVVEAAVGYCDGWAPLEMKTPDLPARVTDVQRRREEAGRPRLEISVFGAKPEQANVDRLAAGGVDRAIFYVPSADRDTVLPLLDQYARLTMK